MIENTSPIARFLVVFAALVIVVSGLKMAGPLLVPFLLAVFVAMIVSPLLGWLKNFQIPSGLAIFLVVMVILLVGLDYSVQVILLVVVLISFLLDHLRRVV